MKPRWLRLASGGKDLTLPYMVGALRVPIGARRSAEEDRAELCDLIRSIENEMPAHHFADIDKCPDKVKGFVVRVRAFSSIWHTSKKPNNLTWVSEIPASDLDGLLEWAWQTYASPLASGDFSCTAGFWRPFEADEKTEITELLAE